MSVKIKKLGTGVRKNGRYYFL